MHKEFWAESHAIAYKKFLERKLTREPDVSMREQVTSISVPDRIWTVRIENSLTPEQQVRSDAFVLQLEKARTKYLQQKEDSYKRLHPSALDTLWKKRLTLDSD